MLLFYLPAAAVISTAWAIPAQGSVRPNGVPQNVPKNETELYPPYHYKAPTHNIYIPSQIGIPFKSYNESKQPWNTKPEAPRARPNVAASCTPLNPSNPSASNYWYEKITHNGISPFIQNGNSYKVFRNVVASYGADSSGNNDAATAIQNAINDGSSSGSSRSNENLGTTGQPAVVYLPAGTYTINSPLQLYVNTVLMGNPLNPPTIKAGSNFNGNHMIYGKDPHQDATTAFYIGIKNLKIDSTAVDKDKSLTLLDWSVSQATQLTNVVFQMPNYSSGHVGIDMPEGGSGTMMGDLTFNGGVIGLNMDNQQYEGKSLIFNGCTTGIKVSHCFDCVFQNINFMNGGNGIDMTGGSVGNIVLLDSTASSVGTVVKTNAESTGDHTLVIENFTKGSGVTNVVSASGKTVLNSGVTDAWVYGNAYTRGGPSTGSHQTGTTYSTPRSASLLANGKFVSLAPPTYGQYDASQVLNVKSVSGLPVYGDGSTDDTNNLNSIISQYAGCKVLFFPQGTYIVTNTLFFPAGSRVIGEAWSAISATGSNFYNPTSPTTMVKVGNAGDKGVAQFSDMLFTVADVLQGCTLLEVNMAGNNPGDVGFWNTHFRVGGARGSKVLTNCGGSPAQCKAAFLMAHLTSSSSAYVENMWGWTADHNLDGGGSSSTTIATGRGMLVEATSATWLHGTAFEHNTLYQYNLRNAQNVFVGMQQSETPYWQGPGASSQAPAPWTPLSSYGDPTYSYCNGDAQCTMALFEQITGCKNLFLYGAGFWTFFDNNNGDCQKSSVCQTNAIDISNTSGLFWYGISTHTNLNVIRNNGATLVTQNNNPGSWGACVGAFLSDN